MSAKHELVPLKRSGMEISIDPKFFQIKGEVLAGGRIIQSVTSDGSLAYAQDIIGRLDELRLEIERARNDLKEPFLAAGKDIDEKAKEAQTGIKEEAQRLSRLAGDYQALVNARLRSMEIIAKNPELSDAEKAYHTSIAEASSLDEVDHIRENRPQGISESTVSDSIAVVAGAPKVKEDWDVTITDIHALYRSNPACVKLEPILSAIKEVIKCGSGALLKGVTYKKVNKV